MRDEVIEDQGQAELPHDQASPGRHLQHRVRHGGPLVVLRDEVHLVRMLMQREGVVVDDCDIATLHD